MATGTIKKTGISFPNYSRHLKSITTANTSWIATEDCWVTGYVNGAVDAVAFVYVDDVICGAGYAANITSTVGVMIPVKKGSVIKTRNYGTYALEIYGC